MTSTDLTYARRDPYDPVTGEVFELGRLLGASGFFGDARDAAQAAVKVMAGRELGFPAIAAMTGVHIIKGKVTLSANLMAAAIKRHPAYTYRILEHTDDRCVIAFFENGEAIGESSYTIADAQRAGLTSNDTWTKHPRSMLFARALSNGAKWHCPDVFGGPAYTPEELGAAVDEEGQPLDQPPAGEPTGFRAAGADEGGPSSPALNGGAPSAAPDGQGSPPAHAGAPAPSTPPAPVVERASGSQVRGIRELQEQAGVTDAQLVNVMRAVKNLDPISLSDYQADELARKYLQRLPKKLVQPVRDSLKATIERAAA